MKIVSLIILMLLITVSAQAWMHLLPDYAKQQKDADLVAIVRMDKVTDTGNTRMLDSKSQIQFRELETEMKILSTLKGRATDSIKCRLYRFPVKKERDADIEQGEADRQYLMATPWQSGLFVPKQHREYLVYLKLSEAGYYLPTTGYTAAIYSIIELNVPFTSNPDKEAEQGGSVQPATRPESKLEGRNQDQTEAEEHSR